MTQFFNGQKILFINRILFDGKSFLIMVFMIAFGIGLRASGLAPEGFIAVFYTGLGASLLLAGALFGRNYGAALSRRRG